MVEFPEIKASSEPTFSELKRAFAILDKKSVPFQMSRMPEVPVAWYEPLQDDAEWSDGSKPYTVSLLLQRDRGF